MIGEETLRQLSFDERATLGRMLASLDDETLAAAAGDPPIATIPERRRRSFATVMTAASIALIPWVVLLGLTLPHRYVAGHWTLTWVGFDVLLLVSLGATGWFAWRKNQAVILAALASGTLLTCDAWFDVTTASGRVDVAVAALTAALLELPLAAMLFFTAHRLLHSTVRRVLVTQALAAKMTLTSSTRLRSTTPVASSDQSPS
jgi:hypothetical protein